MKDAILGVKLKVDKSFINHPGSGFRMFSILFQPNFSLSIPGGLSLHGSPQVAGCDYDALRGGMTKILRYHTILQFLTFVILFSSCEIVKYTLY